MTVRAAVAFCRCVLIVAPSDGDDVEEDIDILEETLDNSSFARSRYQQQFCLSGRTDVPFSPGSGRLSYSESFSGVSYSDRSVEGSTALDEYEHVEDAGLR